MCVCMCVRVCVCVCVCVCYLYIFKMSSVLSRQQNMASAAVNSLVSVVMWSVLVFRSGDYTSVFLFVCLFVNNADKGSVS